MLAGVPELAALCRIENASGRNVIITIMARSRILLCEIKVGLLPPHLR